MTMMMMMMMIIIIITIIIHKVFEIARNINSNMSDFSLPQQCEKDLRCSGILYSVDWLLPKFRINLPVPSSRIKQCK